MNRLTKYASGSVRELLTVAWPLILAAAANTLLVLGDRLVLAHYSQDAFNANVGAMPWYWTIVYTIMNVVVIANVMVGRFNGARQYSRIGGVLWQMIWFSLGLFVFTIPLAIWVAPHLMAPNLKELGVPYLQISLLFLPINFVAFGALASFFTGRGKTKIVSLAVLISNLVNLFFDIVLVFGWGWIPEMGIRGAAWGTVIAEFVGLFILSFLVFQRKYRRRFGTLNYKFNGKIFKECLRIGSPNAFACFVNFALWSGILQMMAIYVSGDNFSAFGISHTVYISLFFLIEGIGQAVATICSNAYGANEWGIIEKNARSWSRIALINSCLIFLVMVVYPFPLVQLLSSHGADPTYDGIVNKMLALSWLAICAESFGFNLRNVLTAFGDTMYIMVANLISYGAIVIIPSYIALRVTSDASSFLWIEAFSQILFTVLFWWRYRHYWLKRFHSLTPLPISG